MRKILLTLLGVVLIVGVTAAAGFTAYRFGYAQGVRVTANRERPGARPFERIGPERMPLHAFGDRFDRGFGPHGFGMRGFRFFAPLRFLGQILVLGLIVLFAYWLFTRSGWQLTRTSPAPIVETPASPPAAPPETETKE
jgi:hypothetical protein